MNQLFLTLGLEGWKPLLVALLLPPVPWLLLTLIAARLLWRGRGWGWLLMLLAVGLTWGSSTTFVAETMTRLLLSPPDALDAREIAALRQRGSGANPKPMVLVLGGGREVYNPEFGMSNLSAISMERLRYGVWLSRETGLPLGFSGGVGPGLPDGPSEAEIASRIAAREFGRPLQLTEAESRDTTENARRTITLVKPQGLPQIVLVTHVAHMPRAVRAFERARDAAGLKLEIVPAPMGTRSAGLPWSIGDFLPSNPGWFKTRYAVREWLGLLAGA